MTFSDSLTTIDSFAFRYCTSLISANIPNSVTTINRDAFSDCKSLTTLTIPNRLTSISTCAFQNCASLTSVIIPESITTIEGDAFLHCTSLASVIIPDGVTSIGERAFNGCGLSSLTIPASVATIDEYAFYNCRSLAVINVEAVNPPQISDNTFQSYDIPLVVPTGSVDAYKAHEVWSKFTNIYEGQLPAGMSDAVSWRGIKLIYSPNGKRLGNLQKGLLIVVDGDGTTRKVLRNH